MTIHHFLKLTNKSINTYEQLLLIFLFFVFSGEFSVVPPIEGKNRPFTRKGIELMAVHKPIQLLFFFEKMNPNIKANDIDLTRNLSSNVNMSKRAFSGFFLKVIKFYNLTHFFSLFVTIVYEKLFYSKLIKVTNKMYKRF